LTRKALIVTLALEILLGILNVLVVVLVLLHKGKGGGLSDLFGGGVSSSLGGSSVAERNLDRITIGLILIWSATIVALGLAI
jgi:preprotein translocase subunit SecG